MATKKKASGARKPSRPNLVGGSGNSGSGSDLKGGGGSGGGGKKKKK